MFKWLKNLFKPEEVDEFEEARMNAAMHCLKTGKAISGKIYNDGTFSTEEQSTDQEELR